MQTTAAILATAMTIVMVVVLPIRGYRRYGAMEAAGDDRTTRSELLRRSMAIKWGCVAVLVVIYVLAGDEAWIFWWGPYAVGLGACLLIGVVLGGVLLAARTRSPKGRAKLAKAAHGFAAMLPRTSSERRQFVAVAVTAGTAEELMYRAFLIAYIHWLWPSGSALAVCAIAGVAFGLVHLYQGPRGVIATGILGILLGLIYLGAGIIVVMVAHTLIDLRLLLIPGDVVTEIAAEPSP